MRIKKNGKVINLTESDLKRIVKRTLSEQEVDPNVNKNMHPEINKQIDNLAYLVKETNDWVERGLEHDKISDNTVKIVKLSEAIVNDLNNNVGNHITRSLLQGRLLAAMKGEIIPWM